LLKLTKPAQNYIFYPKFREGLGQGCFILPIKLSESRALICKITESNFSIHERGNEELVKFYGKKEYNGSKALRLSL
jgi:hypothetical protein